MSGKESGRLILVTGGAGFIGSHLVEALLHRGDRVRVLDNFSTGKREYVEGLEGTASSAGVDFRFIEGDVRDYDTVLEVVSGTDAVFHQAALGSVPRSIEDPMTTQRINADGTLNIFLAARECGVRRVVYASSSSVYGDSPRMPKKEGEEGLPLSPYALTKQVNEGFARLFRDLYGLEAVGLRYFNVYGPRQDPGSQYAAVIPCFVSALLAGRAPVIYGTGEQSRDFTFVEDVVSANLLALEAPEDAGGKSFNVGMGREYDLLQLLDALQDLLGTSIDPRHDPPRAGDVMRSRADPALAREMLGFDAVHALEEGLARSVAWYRENLV
jgi:nucleoside-diphosphate-sugar epimerase